MGGENYLMRVLHVPYCFYPDPVGGTEVYVSSLMTCLSKKNIESSVAAPDIHTHFYQYNNFDVDRFSVSEKINNLEDLHGEGDEKAREEFSRILEKKKPDIVHFHALTRGVSLRLMREAKRQDIKTVFTYHTPTVTCFRGTLLHLGKNICNGKLDKKNCSVCTLHALGVNQVTAKTVNAFSVLLGDKIIKTKLRGKLWTALSMSQLMKLRHAVIYSMMKEVDKLVVLCEWAKKLCMINGVEQEKIMLSRHGLSSKSSSIIKRADMKLNFPLKIVFIGRFDVMKGPDILVKAIRNMLDLEIQFDLYGIVQNKEEKYFNTLKSLAAGDPRIRFLSPVPSEEVISLLCQYHLLVVPSRCLETGPLVVLEAFAAGVPVIGSSLGGIAELVKHQENGLLVKTDSLKDWMHVIRQCCETPSIIDNFKKNIKPPRSMELVSTEMAALYYQLCQN